LDTGRQDEAMAENTHKDEPLEVLEGCSLPECRDYRRLNNCPLNLKNITATM
jgi:hypothetical protein